MLAIMSVSFCGGRRHIGIVDRDSAFAWRKKVPVASGEQEIRERSGVRLGDVFVKNGGESFDLGRG